MHRYGNAVRPRQDELAQSNNHVPRAELLQANLSHSVSTSLRGRAMASARSARAMES